MKRFEIKYKKLMIGFSYRLTLETRIAVLNFDKTTPFYRLDNVETTHICCICIMREQSREMTAAVVSTVNDKPLGNKVAG